MQTKQAKNLRILETVLFLSFIYSSRSSKHFASFNYAQHGNNRLRGRDWNASWRNSVLKIFRNTIFRTILLKNQFWLPRVQTGIHVRKIPRRRLWRLSVSFRINHLRTATCFARSKYSLNAIPPLVPSPNYWLHFHSLCLTFHQFNIESMEKQSETTFSNPL